MKINLNEFIPYYVTRFAKSYSYLKKINNLDKDKSIIICYENLKRDTKKTLKDILHFMEIVYDDDLVDETINRSSIKMVKSFEKKGEYYSDKNKSHIRNGGIGEWKNYLRRKDINYIEKILSEFKLSLNMFILE